MAIETISSKKYNSIEKVWHKHPSLSVVGGYILHRIKTQRLGRLGKYSWSYQVLNFDLEEVRRTQYYP